MNNVISRIANDFIQEALSSPRMLEDLASMERYMAESYDGRVFIELLQNADDAKANRIIVQVDGDCIVVANDGRAFNEQDIMSICRSGASSKQRGNGIGYRGIGFKSATSISTEIVIHSGDSYFTFSKQRCANRLGKQTSQVPTVRVPFLVDESDLPQSIRKLLSNLEADGYTTFFVFTHCDKDKFLSELTGINSGWMLFLNSIDSIIVNVESLSDTYKVIRKTNKHGYSQLHILGDENEWVVASDENASVAFKFDSNYGIVPSSYEEALFYCYLPTLDSAGFPMKANADFSTDPSRKHIIMNDSASLACIKSIAQLTYKFIQKAVFDDKTVGVLNIFCNHIGLSEPATMFEKELLALLSNNNWIPLCNGTTVRPDMIKLAPDWIDEKSRQTICKNLPSLMSFEINPLVLRNTERLSMLLSSCGAKQYDSVDLSCILQSVDVVTALDERFVGIAWGYAFRMSYYSTALFDNCYIPLEGKHLIKACDATGNIYPSSLFLDGLTVILRSEELEKLSDGIPVLKRIELKRSTMSEKRKYENRTNDSTGSSKMSKWKTPMQNCIAYMKSSGFIAKDVSKQGFGYDVVYTDLGGSTKHVVIKPVRTLGDAFSLSDAEFSKMQELGSNFEAFIVASDEPETNCLLIDLGSVSFEKRVKEWEHICLQYSVSDRRKVAETPRCVDSELIKTFSLKYLNRVQRELIRMLIENGDVIRFAQDNQCNIKVLYTQINGVADFYSGKEILDWINEKPVIKECFFGSIEYMLRNM